MNRRTFTRCCITCVGGAALAPVLAGCQGTYYTQGSITATGISVNKSEFTYMRKDRSMLRDYIVVRNEKLSYPIYVYRFSDEEYSAVLMKCTHQGATLTASGDHLHCPSHGSEFDNRGALAQGPAESSLRTFKVSADNEIILIDLRS